MTLADSPVSKPARYLVVGWMETVAASGLGEREEAGQQTAVGEAAWRIVWPNDSMGQHQKNDTA